MGTGRGVPALAGLVARPVTAERQYRGTQPPGAAALLCGLVYVRGCSLKDALCPLGSSVSSSSISRTRGVACLSQLLAAWPCSGP